MTGVPYKGRVGLQQRVLPTYRVAFIEELARQCLGGLSVLAGEPLLSEGIEPAGQLGQARLVRAKNWCFLDPSSAWFLFWQSGLMEWLKDWKPDVLIVEANPRYLLTGKACAWMHQRRKKVIGWGLGAPEISGALSAMRRKQRQRLLMSLDAIVAYSQQGAAQYRQAGVAAERVFVAANAVAPAPATPPPHRLPTFEGQPTVLFVGRLQARKRVDLLIQACAALPETLQPRLLIVGEGQERDELQHIASTVYPSAKFSGAKHGEELEPYFAQADLFVLPGTGGLAIQQAMAHGLPVVVARGDGTQDDLVRNENGWQVAPDDLQALVNVLQAAMTDPARLRRMGEASYRIVAHEINVEKMAEVFVQAIHAVMGEK